MTQITLVLPFALPPPELAPDLVRALKAPALAALLSRTSRRQSTPFEDHVRVLPHEWWLARALGLAASERPAFAHAAMRGYGLEAGEGTWFIVTPAHVEIARSHLLMADMRRLHLSEPHARALFDVAKPYFDEVGKTLLYGDAHTWFMRADSWADLATSTPDSTTGQNLTDLMPRGARAIEYRKLQNEVQMLWYGHPANVEREQQGLAAVNAFWPWAASSSAPASMPALATADGPSWLTALAQQRAITPEAIANAPTDTLAVCDALSEPAVAGDWAGWLQQMQRLDETLFAPVLAALGKGTLDAVKLVLSRRDAHTEITTSKMAQMKFWRRPSLDQLLS